MKRPPLEPLSLADLATESLSERPSKVGLSHLGRPWEPGGTLGDFLASLPCVLAAETFREAAGAIARAARGKRTVILALGAHAVKVGLSPVIIGAMRRGIITGLALNGAGVIHDTELALAGKTSEDVAERLGGGAFGMARETAEFINGAVAEGYRRGGVGLGAAVGEALLQSGAPHTDASLLAQAAALGVPATVHVALGTDIIHMHPTCDGAATGALSHLDFRIFCRMVAGLAGGVHINLGSAVVLPEVFLKAVSVALNLGHSLSGLTTLNMDFVRHYRPETNVVRRPTAGRGRGLTLVGHHEIMFPLLLAAVAENLSRE